jgi:4'-phosphopantetheinyl transferase
VPTVARRRRHPTVADVWIVALDVVAGERMTVALPRAEIEAAHAIPAGVLRDRALAGRAALRSILGGYLDIAPARVPIMFSPCRRCGRPHGKPMLAGGDLHFNVSHSGPLALVAVCENQVGVDLERVDPRRNVELLAGSVLCDEEAAEIAGLAAEGRLRAFFDCWTRKEALLKATGEGLTRSPKDVRVPASRGAVVSIGALASGGAEWTLADFAPAAGYAGAVAVAGPGPLVVQRRLARGPHWISARATEPFVGPSRASDAAQKPSSPLRMTLSVTALVAMPQWLAVTSTFRPTGSRHARQSTMPSRRE